MPDRKIQRFFIGWSALILWSACSHTPKGIIPEKKMCDLLVDMQMAETIMNDDPYTYGSVRQKNALFQSVFKKHNLTQAEYDSSLICYGKNIDIYMRVHDMAMAETDRRIKALGEVEAETFDVLPSDSVDLWVGKRCYIFFPKAMTNMVVFDLKPTEAYPADGRFVWEMQVWGLTPEKHVMELNLRADVSDSTLVVKDSIVGNGFYQYTLQGTPYDPVQRVYGYIRLKKSPAIPYPKIYIDRIRLMRYRVGE